MGRGLGGRLLSVPTSALPDVKDAWDVMLTK